MSMATKFDQIPQCGLTEKSLSYQSDHLTFCLAHYVVLALITAITWLPAYWYCKSSQNYTEQNALFSLVMGIYKKQVRTLMMASVCILCKSY